MTGGQLAMVCLFCLSLGEALANHGKPKTGTHNFWISLFAVATEYCILRWGGFWS